MTTVGEGWTGSGGRAFPDGPTPHTAATCRGWGQEVEGSGDGEAEGSPGVSRADEGTDAVNGGGCTCTDCVETCEI